MSEPEPGGSAEAKSGSKSERGEWLKTIPTLIAAVTALVTAIAALRKPPDTTAAKASYEELSKLVEKLEDASDQNHRDIVELNGFLRGYLSAKGYTEERVAGLGAAGAGSAGGADTPATKDDPGRSNGATGKGTGVGKRLTPTPSPTPAPATPATAETESAALPKEKPVQILVPRGPGEAATRLTIPGVFSRPPMARPGNFDRLVERKRAQQEQAKPEEPPPVSPPSPAERSPAPR